MPYLIKTSTAKMPASVHSRYIHTAVLEVHAGVESVKMISERARGVVRIVRRWGPSYVGSTLKCAASRDLAKAHALLRELES